MLNSSLEWTDETGQSHRREVVDKVFIGRTCEGIAESKRIIVRDSSVSRDHAIVSMDGRRLQISDLSKNGVWINDVRMAAGALEVLKDGDVIDVGRAKFVVRFQGSETSPGKVDSTMMGPLEMFVTTLVADVRGYSAMAQTQETRRVADLMKDIFESMTEVVRDYHGTIKDFVGDAIYAFWEHRHEPRKEEALAACHAALKQIEVLEERQFSKLTGGTQEAEPLRMGWGITTGKVVVTHFGQRGPDLALVGDSTVLARLSQLGPDFDVSR